MNTPRDTQPNILEFIKRAIEAEIKIVTDQEFEKMKERLDQRKAEIVAGVILNAQRSMSVNTSGDLLTISVKLT